MELEINPFQLIGEEALENLAYIFLEGTYERLDKDMNIPKLTHFTEKDLEDYVFFTDTHDIQISIQKDISAEIYHAKITVSIVMHDTQMELYRGSKSRNLSHGTWQAIDNLKFLALYNREDLRKELINDVHNKFKIVSDTDPNEIIMGNLDGIWNVRVVDVTLSDGFYEFFPDNNTNNDSIRGVAIDFDYDVILLDERQYDPSNLSSDFLVKKSQNWKKM